MPRIARKCSESGIYHITTRGAGRRILFEDDKDKSAFIRKVSRSSVDQDVSILAWCLMDNHYHLLLKGDLRKISSMMHQVNTYLSHSYNGKYGHVGPVIQDRFSSSPVENDTYLIEIIRYIHLNPRDTGNDFRSYKWSSYMQYLGSKGICDVRLALDILGGKDEFVRFHDIGEDDLEMLEFKPTRPRLSDTEAKTIATHAFGSDFGDEISTMSKEQRNAALRKLYGMGISIRQLERLTGIGRGIIQPAVKKR